MSELTKEQLEGAVRKAVEQMAEDGELTSDRQREQQAASAFVVSDLRYGEQQGLKPSEVLAERYDIDVDDYDDAEELHAAVASAREELRETSAPRGASLRGR